MIPFWIFVVLAATAGLIIGALLEKWDSNRVASKVVDKLTGGVASGTSALEQDVLTAIRKHTGKAPAPPAPSAQMKMPTPDYYGAQQSLNTAAGASPPPA